MFTSVRLFVPMPGIDAVSTVPGTRSHRPFAPTVALPVASVTVLNETGTAAVGVCTVRSTVVPGENPTRKTKSLSRDPCNVPRWLELSTAIPNPVRVVTFPATSVTSAYNVALSGLPFTGVVSGTPVVSNGTV